MVDSSGTTYPTPFGSETKSNLNLSNLFGASTECVLFINSQRWGPPQPTPPWSNSFNYWGDTSIIIPARGIIHKL